MATEALRSFQTLPAWPALVPRRSFLCGTWVNPLTLWPCLMSYPSPIAYILPFVPGTRVSRKKQGVEPISLRGHD